MSELILNASGADFEAEVLHSGVPVLVDYWAEWCAPCKAMAPILDQVAADYQGRLRIAKVNVETEPQLARQFGVRSQPTLMLFKNGAVEAQKVGAMSRSQLQAFIDLNL